MKEARASGVRIAVRASPSTSRAAWAVVSTSLLLAPGCGPAAAPATVTHSAAPAPAPLLARSRALPPPCAAPVAPPDQAVCGTPEAPCVVLARTPLADWQANGLELVNGQPVPSTLPSPGLLVVEQGRFVHHPAPTDGQLRAAQYLVDGAGGVLLTQRPVGAAQVGYMRPESAPLFVEPEGHIVVLGGAEPHLLARGPGATLTHVRFEGGRRVERALFRPEETDLPGGLASTRTAHWLSGLPTATSIRAFFIVSTLQGQRTCRDPFLPPDDAPPPGHARRREARDDAPCAVRDGQYVAAEVFVAGADGEPVALPLHTPPPGSPQSKGDPLRSPQLDSEGRIHAISGGDCVVLGIAGQPAVEVAPPAPRAPRSAPKT